MNRSCLSNRQAHGASLASTRSGEPEQSGTRAAGRELSGSTAFFRNYSRVDTLKTKSLCCAAAGITALGSCVPQVLIPHEMLRGAGSIEASLIAQCAPPAQPAEGYNSLPYGCVRGMRPEVLNA